jgi:hypothetical protein
MKERRNKPNDILRPSRSLRIIVLGHVSASTTAGGVDLALQGWGLEGYGVEVGGDCATDVALFSSV